MTAPRMTPTNDAPVTVEQLEMQAHRLDRLREDNDKPTLTDRAVLRETADMLRRLAALASAPAGDGVEERDVDITFLNDAARYFEKRPIGGDDMAHWSNLANAQACRRIADRLSALLDDRARDHANINLKADFIDKTLDQLAEADQRITELHAALARPRAAVGEQSREAIARALAQRWIDRGNARVTGATYSCWEEMPGSYTRDFYDDADAALAALAPTPADDEATYTRWLAGDETLPPLPREQYLRFQARSDRVIEDRRHVPSCAGGGVEEVRRNPEDSEWSYCPACKTGFLDTGYECNSCGFDARPLVELQAACEARGERMHPSGLYESEIANPIRLALQSPPAKVEG